MWIKFVNLFTKLTGFPVQFICFRTHIFYEDKTVQGRKIKGPAIIVSNHTSVFDFAVYMFVFFGRNLRALMAEVLFEKPVLGWFLKSLGGIRVHRSSSDLDFLSEAENVLNRGGVVEVFPEGRLPRPGEAKPLEFKLSAAYLALSTGARIIPVYTDGSYFRKKHANVIIGTPIDSGLAEKSGASEEEQLKLLTTACRNKIIELEKLLNEQTEKKAL